MSKKTITKERADALRKQRHVLADDIYNSMFPIVFAASEKMKTYFARERQRLQTAADTVDAILARVPDRLYEYTQEMKECANRLFNKRLKVIQEREASGRARRKPRKAAKRKRR